MNDANMHAIVTSQVVGHKDVVAIISFGDRYSHSNVTEKALKKNHPKKKNIHKY